MENRRQPTGITPRPPNQNSNPGNGIKRPFETRSFQNRDSRAESDRYQNRGDEFPNRDAGRQSEGVGKFQPKNCFDSKGKNIKPWEREKPLPRIVSEMQITDGRHRGKNLQSTASPNVRPTARRVREVMFRILYRRVRAGRFLDLCAGSGMVGIEAISRGALIATFVERSARMCSFIKKNLEVCGIKEGHGEVVETEVVPFLKQMHKRRRHWDVVYFDPPYDSNYDDVLAYFSRGAAIKSKGVLIIEHHSDMFFPEKFGVMSRWRVLVQGETTLSFYERK